MKKSIIALMLALFVPTGLFAQSHSDEHNTWRPYLRADYGVSMGTTHFGKKGADDNTLVEVGALTNLSIGAQKEQIKLELAYQERESVSEMFTSAFGLESRFDAFAFMGNAYYEYLKKEHFSMYIGAGAGTDRYHWKTSISNAQASDKGWSFIGGLYAGVSFTWEHFAWDLGFDYYYINTPETNSYVPKTGIRIIF